MSFIHMVGMICPPEKEEKFNQWYNEKHVPALMKFNGVKRAIRYRMAAKTPAGETQSALTVAKESYPKFLAVYEFGDQQSFQRYEKSPEHAAVREDWLAAKDDLGAEIFWRVQYESIRAWER